MEKNQIGNEDEVRRDLDRIRTQLNNKFKKKSKDPIPFVMTGEEAKERLKPDYVSTGVPELDDALGGGIAYGSILHIHGEDGIGKSALALSIAGQIQKATGKWALIINAENSGLEEQARLVGLDWDKTHYIEATDYGELLVDTVDSYLYDSEEHAPRGLIGVVVLDSVDGLVPKAIIDSFEEKGSEGVPQLGRRAKLIGDLLSRVSGRGMLRTGCVFIIVGQEKANVSGYGSPTMASGGFSLKYFAKVRIRLGGKKFTVLGDQKIGHTVTYDVTKNNVAGKLPKGEYSVVYGKGVDDGDALAARAESHGYVVRWKEGLRTDFLILLPGRDLLVRGGKQAVRDRIKVDEAIKNELRPFLKSPKPPSVLPEPSGNIVDEEKLVTKEKEEE